MIFEKKVFLKVCLIHIYEIFKTDLQKGCHMYSFSKCIIATIKEYRVIFLSCLIKNSYCGQEDKARSLRKPAFESPMSDVYSNVFVEN